MKQKTKALAMHKSTNLVLITLIVAALLAYIYLANTVVRTVTSLQGTKSEVEILSVKISEMESARLVLDNKITVEMAKSLGFKEVNKRTFIMHKSPKTAFDF